MPKRQLDPSSASGADGKSMDKRMQELTEAIHSMSLASNPRARTVPAPTFDGSGDVDQFLRQFKAVAMLNSWSTEETKLRFELAVSGAASRGMTGRELPEMYSDLRARYSLSESGANTLLKTIKWKPHENIHEFSAHLRRIVDVAYSDMTEEQREARAIKELTNALPPACQTLVWELTMKVPSTFREAVEVIQRFSELNQGQLKVNRVDIEEMATLKKTVESQSAMIDQLIASQAELTKQLASVVQSRQGERKCYRCQQPGHIAKDCRQKRMGNDAVQQE